MKSSIADLDQSIRPQDDLYRHVNGAWLAATEIPADRARTGSFVKLVDEAELAVRQIIQRAESAPAGSDERKVGDAFASFMDEQRVDELGAGPILPLISEATAPTSVPEFLATLGQLEVQGVRGLIAQFIDNDPGDPSRYLMFWEQAGIGLPDEIYFREESFAEIRAKYRDHLARMLRFVEDEESAERDADLAFALEQDIAKVHWEATESRDAQKTYNLSAAREAFPALAPWLDAQDAPASAYDEIVVRQPSFVDGVLALLTEERLESWKAWLRAHIVVSFAAYLSNEISKANFEFFGTVLQGTEQQRARWKRGIGFVEGALGDVVGRLYVEEHFKPEAKTRMDELVHQLIEAYRESITSLEWMTPETRQRALEKLDKFTPKIGYPVKWKTYQDLEIGESLIANVMAANLHEHRRELKKLGGPIDRDEWFMPPQMVNAYYNPGFNEIVFPAAILQPPFFDLERDDAENYGAIGAVIGHEIGHGFDDQGSRYDGDGLLTDWWTDEDRAAFEQRTASLIEQYGALAPTEAPDHQVNGELTIGENIGDLGGLGIAWKAYLRSLDGAEPPVINGLTAAQRFFLAWAASWQTKIRPAEAIRLVSIDPHSPAEHRANQTPKNLDVFVEAFDVKEGDALWLAPEQRVTIW